jgi:hypothetical protein
MLEDTHNGEPRLGAEADSVPAADQGYRVGYGRPPLQSQFKPGTSGNKQWFVLDFRLDFADVHDGRAEVQSENRDVETSCLDLAGHLDATTRGALTRTTDGARAAPGHRSVANVCCARLARFRQRLM